MRMIVCALAGALAVTAFVLPAAAQPRGRLQEVVVRGAALEGNRLGVSPDRAVTIYLPPSYETGTRRYPVVYVLHGIMDSHRTWTEGWDRRYPGHATLQDLMDRGIAAGVLEEMILVIPDAEKTCHYTDSPVKGGWGTFVARDLVRYVDRTYRTQASPDRRGLLGHSMGGHGAIKIAMTHPGVFGVVYGLNPSLLGWGGDVSPDNPALAAVTALRTPADVAQAGFYAQAVIGVGQCFAPDVDAPLLTRLPFAAGADGRVDAGPGHAAWTAEMPVHMVPGHVAALKALRGLRFDSAFTDEFSHIPVTARALSAALDAAGVPHGFEMYNGGHRDRLWGPEGRIATAALPFFSRLLGDAADVAVAPGADAPASPSRSAPGATPAPPAPAIDEAPAPATPAQVRLWDAAIKGDVRAAGAALAAGADLHALDTRSATSGRRPLNHAAEHNRAEMIRWLAARGADLNRANRTGFTPLHHAAESGSAAAAEALIALGASLKATLPSGSTPLSVARQRGHEDVARIIASAGGDPRQAHARVTDARASGVSPAATRHLNEGCRTS